MCLLKQSDLDNATETYYFMNDSTKQEPMTVYLAFKLALLKGDHEMAGKSLEQIGTMPADQPEYLYACCMEAQRADDKLCAFKGLQILVQRYPDVKSKTVHLPALLRSAIRLGHQLSTEDETPEATRHALNEEIYGIFQGG